MAEALEQYARGARLVGQPQLSLTATARSARPSGLLRGKLLPPLGIWLRDLFPEDRAGDAASRPTHQGVPP
jgi:hypothetical protein